MGESPTVRACSDGSADLKVGDDVVAIPAQDILQIAEFFLVGVNTGRGITIGCTDGDVVHIGVADLAAVASALRAIAGIEQV